VSGFSTGFVGSTFATCFGLVSGFSAGFVGSTFETCFGLLSTALTSTVFGFSTCFGDSTALT